jgi:hypothetical protein
MFDIFKQDIKVGDKVKLSLTTGKEPEGMVLEIGDNFVLLESDDKTKSRYFDKLIGGWGVLHQTISTSQTEKIKDTPETSNNPINETKLIGPKIIGKIELPESKKAIEKKPKEPKPKAQKPKENFQMKKGTVKDFSQLGELLTSEQKKQIEESAKWENESIVSANGYITKYFNDRKFGFIMDKFGYDIFFTANDIHDDSLSKALIVTSTKLQIPVLFTLSKNLKVDKAILVHKPETVNSLLKRAELYTEKKDYSTALGFIEQILYSFPNK